MMQTHKVREQVSPVCCHQLPRIQHQLCYQTTTIQCTELIIEMPLSRYLRYGDARNTDIIPILSSNGNGLDEMKEKPFLQNVGN